MTAEVLFAALHRRGVKLEAVAGGLRYRAPHGTLTPEMLDDLRTHKGALLTLLNPDETLPDEIVVPASCPNDVESIKTCIDAQRVGRAA